jgi:hypothetical protein
MQSTMSFPRRSIPPGVRVRQRLSHDHIADVRAEVRRRLIDAGLRDRVKPGHRIAITAGSRGMGGLVDLLSGIVDAVREAGGQPFIIPAMGSHGGATPEGQLEILRRLGVTDAVGAPIQATMETIELGRAEGGATAHLDRRAAEADGIIVLGRVKTHPEYEGDLAAGLLKMTTIGLGKQRGAQEAHNHGLWPSVRSVPKVTLAKAPIRFGVSVVENAFRQPVAIEAVPASYDAFLEADVRLLELARSHLPPLPFERIDLLVVDALGKDISGTGMDLNVIGRWRVNGGQRVPDIRRIVVLSLTHASLGNGLGIGLADFTTRRFVEAFDPAVTYVNLLTASEPGSMNTREGVLPLALPSDQEALEVALYSALAGDRPRVCRIKHTDALDELWVSEALLAEVEQNPRLTVLGRPAPLEYDDRGDLIG